MEENNLDFKTQFGPPTILPMCGSLQRRGLIVLIFYLFCQNGKIQVSASNFATNFTVDDITFSSAFLSWDIPEMITENTTYELREYKALISTANFTISNPAITNVTVVGLHYASHYEYILITWHENTTELGRERIHFVTKYEHWNIWDKIACECAGFILFCLIISMLIKCNSDPTKKYNKVKKKIVEMKVREREEKKRKNKKNKILPV